MFVTIVPHSQNYQLCGVDAALGVTAAFNLSYLEAVRTERNGVQFRPFYDLSERDQEFIRSAHSARTPKGRR